MMRELGVKARRNHKPKITKKTRSTVAESPPRISVIMPTYNEAEYINETIESVIRQDYNKLELIVVDRGSTDETLEILKSYAHLGVNRFRYVSEPDRGRAHAINTGISLARGTLVSWLSADDTYYPGAVSQAVRSFTKHTSWAMIYGNVNYVNENSEVLSAFPTKPFDRKKLFEECFICQPATFLRKEAIIQVGGVDESKQICMDYDLWVRLAKFHSIGYVENTMASTRLHDANQSILLMNEIGSKEELHHRS